MVVPFGVSVGDFIAGIELIRDVADALKESCSSSSDFRDLVRELYSLERALISLKNVIDPKNPESLPYDVAHVDGLKQMVLQIRQTIDEFLSKNKKFVLSLGVAGGRRSGVRDWARKVEWGRYKTEDVQGLRWKLNGHSRAVSMVLYSMELEAIGKSNTLISDMSKTLVTMKTQASDLHKLMVEVLATNLQIYQEVCAGRTQVPAQVLLQEPVLFWDARGHLAPFHLDFVNSAEAFIAVLKARFKEVGLNKIEKGEFVISDVATKRDIDLLKSWNRCFRPGQKVHMSMIFDSSPWNKDNSCPVCGFINFGSLDTEIKCGQCGRYYQRITELSPYQENSSASATTMGMRTDTNAGRSGGYQINQTRYRWSFTTGSDSTVLEEEDEDETLPEYSRVRLHIRDFARWNPRGTGPYCHVLAGGSEVEFAYLPRGADPHAIAIRADTPMKELSDEGVAYFEIWVHQTGTLHRDGTIVRNEAIAIGFASSKTSLNEMPGFGPNSWGYYSDTGKTFECGSPGKPYGPPLGDWWKEHVIGCGIDFQSGNVFFTRNGRHLGVAFRRLSTEGSQTWYPCVGRAGKRDKMTFSGNFGQKPFMYDIDGYRDSREQH